MIQNCIAQVYVESALYHMDRPFDYLVPSEMRERLKPGCRVLVPFGRSNKKVQGLVVSLSGQAEKAGQLKAVHAQLDEEPVITQEFFVILEYLVKNTFCCYYDAVKCVLPAGKNVDVIETYRLKPGAEELDLTELSPEEQRVVAYLRTAKTARELNAFLEHRGNPHKQMVVKSLLERGILVRTDREKRKASQKTVKMVRLAEGFDPARVKLTRKQREVVDMLLDVQAAMIKELCYLCGVTDGVIRTLEKKGFLSFFERAVDPSYSPGVLNQPGSNAVGLETLTLSPKQREVYAGIGALMDRGEPAAALLFGVTGSGKTQVYVKLIEKAVVAGKTAMLLVPEIALTPQLVEKFKGLFGQIVAVIHSSLSLTERLEQHERIQKGDAKIVIGTRSAVFAPLSNIGLIILDEEGESSYKSEASPRYHARDIAKLRSLQHNAVTLLSSATPSIDSYYQAQEGKYHLFSIEERYANANLPNVYLVDMFEEQKKKNFSPISVLLAEQIAINLQAGEQSILLINRRGYHTFATCMDCGEVMKCPSCDVSMTYHRANGHMMCHYCGHAEPFVAECPSCKSGYIKLTGVGTQRLEDELTALFQKARILRMDTDTTYSKYSYEKNFAAFGRGEYDILLGTQMIAKGLDFPNVTLVGVLHADSGLYATDFRAGERIFSLITQVVGRSGRRGKAGRAYIQTMNPDNPIINFAASQDYKGFYEDEISVRKAMFYPPFCDIVTFLFSGENEERAAAAAHFGAAILQQEASKSKGIAVKVLGVTRAAIYKISNKYRYRIIMKCRFNNNMKQVISDTLKRCAASKEFRGVSCSASVNGDIG